MGGDHAPGAVVQGCLDAVRELGIEVALVGPEPVLRAEVDRRGGLIPGVSLVHAPEVITTHEAPVMAVRRKRDSSLVTAMRLVRDGQADAFLSAGSTGAILAAGLFVVGRLPGVDRPALGAALPSRSGRPVLLLDVGANVDSRPEHLVQWAVLGTIYARVALGRPDPAVAILNIGAEEEKGNALVKAALPLLKQAPGIRFVGSVEPRDLPDGPVDVVVADGFVGNVVLKLYEGLGLALGAMVKEALLSSPLAALGGLLARPALQRLGRRLDYTEYGGAPLLGLQAPVVKCHGSSNARAIKNGLRVVQSLVQGGAVAAMAAQVAALQGAGAPGEETDGNG